MHHRGWALWLVVAALVIPNGTQAAETGFLDRVVTSGGRNHRYQVYVPAEYDSSRRWPVVLWLHGAGTQGSDGLLPTARGVGDYIRQYRGDFPAIAVFPQAPPGRNWIESDVEALAIMTLDRTLAEFSVDTDRISVVGYSMGAVGAYRIASRWPERFAALVAIAGRAEVSKLSPQLEQADRELHPYVNAADPFAALADQLKPMAVRLFHGENDSTIEAEQSRKLFAALQRAGARDTEFAGVDHNAAPDKAIFESGLFPWLLAQKRGG